MKKIYLFLSAAILFKTATVQAFSVSHDFSVQIGPFDASRTNFEYALTPTEYRVESVVKTNGLFDTLYPFRADYATTGRINGDELETLSYKYKSKSRFSSRSRELVYDKNGVPLYRLSSKNGKEKKVDILPDAKNKDTTDLQTVFAELARQYNKLKFCDSRMEVFDGKRRYDVIFKDEGKEQLNDEPKHYRKGLKRCPNPNFYYRQVHWLNLKPPFCMVPMPFMPAHRICASAHNPNFQWKNCKKALNLFTNTAKKST